MLWTILIGVLVGFGTMVPRTERDPVGTIVAVAVALAGSIVPAMLGQALGWYRTGEPAGIISSVVGAIFLSCVYLALLMRELRETDLTAKRSSH